MLQYSLDFLVKISLVIVMMISMLNYLISINFINDFIVNVYLLILIYHWMI